MSVQNRRKHDSEFKRNAVLLSGEPGRTVPEVVANLGINSNRISLAPTNGQERLLSLSWAWGKMGLTPDQQRIRELEKKFKDTEIEREILKKPCTSSAGRRNEIQIR